MSEGKFIRSSSVRPKGLFWRELPWCTLFCQFSGKCFWIFLVSTALRLTMQIRTLTVKFRCGLFLFVQVDKKSESLFWIVLEYHSIQAAARHLCDIHFPLMFLWERNHTLYYWHARTRGFARNWYLFVCFLLILTFGTRLVSLLWQPSAAIVLPFFMFCDQNDKFDDSLRGFMLFQTPHVFLVFIKFDNLLRGSCFRGFYMILCFVIKTTNLMTPCSVYGVKTQTLNLKTVVSKP